MTDNHKLQDFLQSSKKEAFLQSESWLKFQKETGRETFHIEDFSRGEHTGGNFCVWINVIANTLPIVGKYFYIPRGPVMTGNKDVNLIRRDEFKKMIDHLLWLAADNGAGWIRFEPRSEKDLILVQEALKMTKFRGKKLALEKSPHDVQPKEIFVMDISKGEEQLLSEMKSKTRYNIRLAERKSVIIRHWESVSDKKKYLEEFLKLNRETAERDGIITHEDDYYRKMVEVLPEDMISVYLAEYEGKVIAANLVIFFGDTATYAHRASSNENRDVMAPYLLQWKQIQSAKQKGCKYYDFGGVATKKNAENSQIIKKWEGITRFKTGFSQNPDSVVFPGCYDIIMNPRKYSIYRGLQKARSFMKSLR